MNLIYVNVLGGPPFNYVLERLNKQGNVCVVQPEVIEATELEQLKQCASDLILSEEIPKDIDLVDFLVRLAKDKEAAAIITFDEFYLAEVSAACELLGLEGPGKNVERSLRKDIMYQYFDRFDLLKRPFISACDTAPLLTDNIEAPYLIKPSNCAGSLGISLFESAVVDAAALSSVIGKTRQSIEEVVGNMPHKSYLLDQPLIKEGMLTGDAEYWFGEDTPYADYISVEGLIVSGIYYPIAITQNLPMIYPFTETVSISPCTLEPALQRDIIQQIGSCLEAMELGTCGTHTEIKLMRDGQFAIIESAARYAGWCILPQIEKTFKIDMISLYVEALTTPAFTCELDLSANLDTIHCFSATLNLLPVDEKNQAWEQELVFNRNPDFTKLINEHSTYTFTPYIAKGDKIPVLNPIKGAWNSYGKIFLTSKNEQSLLDDLNIIRSNIKQLIQ